MNTNNGEVVNKFINVGSIDVYETINYKPDINI